MPKKGGLSAGYDTASDTFRNSPISIHIIVEGKLFMLENGAFGKNAHADSVSNKPF